MEGFTPRLEAGNFLLADELQFRTGLEGAGADKAKITYAGPGGLVRLYPERKHYADFVIWANGNPDGLAIEQDGYVNGLPVNGRGIKQSTLQNIHVHSASERCFNFNASVFGAYGIGLKAFCQGINDGTQHWRDAIGFYVVPENPRGTQTGVNLSVGWTLLNPTVYGGDTAYVQRNGTVTLISPEFAGDVRRWMQMNGVKATVLAPDFEDCRAPSQFFNCQIAVVGGFSDTYRKDGSVWPIENRPFSGQGRAFYSLSGPTCRIKFDRHVFTNYTGHAEGAGVAMNLVSTSADAFVANGPGASIGEKFIVSANTPNARRVQRLGERQAFHFSRTFAAAASASQLFVGNGNGTRHLASRGGILHTLCYLEDGAANAFSVSLTLVVTRSDGTQRSSTPFNAFIAGQAGGAARRRDLTFSEVRFEAGDTITLAVSSSNTGSGGPYPYTQTVILEADLD